MTNHKVGRYQVKKRLGLVPHKYIFASCSHATRQPSQVRLDHDQAFKFVTCTRCGHIFSSRPA